MSKYHASQEYTIHTRKPGRFEGGVISYPIVDSLKELARQVAKVQRMKVHKDPAWHSIIRVTRGVRNPTWHGDYVFRDGKLIKVKGATKPWLPL